MKITVIGTGSVGSTLANKWAETGHEVQYGIRAVNERVEARLAEANGKITAQPIPAAIEQAEVVLMAIPGKAMDDFLAEHGARLSHKIVIDATNKSTSPATNLGMRLDDVTCTNSTIKSLQEQALH